ncbi:MAG: hypothetical protein CSB49_02830 [Proteobacteria bacterium]|nr:MAG: hypothetical protein CSB49_02830 [Pseudomonadota bacterium]
MRRVFLLTLTLTLSLLGAACGEEKTAQEQVIRPVKTQAVRLVGGELKRTFTAKSQAGSTSNLSFKVNGQLSKLLVKVGDTVKKGQLIAVVDGSDIRLKLRQVQAAYAQARAQSRNAQASYRRVRKLYENRSVSISDLDTARASADSAKASLAAQGQAVAQLRQQLSYCKLHAPTAGQIASVPVNINENIKAGQAIATLNAGTRAEVVFNVPSSLIGSVRKGAKASARFSALKDAPCDAEVSEVGIVAGGTAFQVVAKLLNPPRGVRAGMAAEVTLDLGDKAKATRKRLFVPAHAVLEDRRGRFVFIAEGARGQLGRIARRAVTIGKLAPEGLEVRSGLKAGELVVTAGVRFIEAGMQVRILAK